MYTKFIELTRNDQSIILNLNSELIEIKEIDNKIINIEEASISIDDNYFINDLIDEYNYTHNNKEFLIKKIENYFLYQNNKKYEEETQTILEMIELLESVNVLDDEMIMLLQEMHSDYYIKCLTINLDLLNDNNLILKDKIDNSKDIMEGYMSGKKTNYINQ